MFRRARTKSRWSMKFRLSAVKVEKVVSPPRRPAVRKDLRFGDESWGRFRNRPMRKQPTRFTRSVA